MKSYSLLSLSKKLLFRNKSQFSNFVTPLSKFSFSTVVTPGTTPRKHGGLKDQDRIFTNLYRDGDQFIEGALKRVKFYLNF